MVRMATGGQQPHVVAVSRIIASKWPNIPEIGGYRRGDPQDHGKGLAIDVMVTRLGNKAAGSQEQLGNEIAAWAQANAASLGVTYVIWQNRIWNSGRDKPDLPHSQWRSQHKVGNTYAHWDHVHISFSATPGSMTGLKDGGSNAGGSNAGGSGGLFGSLGILMDPKTWWRVLWAVTGFALVLFSIIRMTGVSL